MKIWLTLCALAIAALAAANVATLPRRVPPPPHSARTNDDPVTQQDARFTRAAHALATRRLRGPIGYLTDVDPAVLARDDRAMQDYFMSQFALAPYVLEAKFTDCAWVVTNFRERSPAERVPADYGVVEDFGGGVLLLRRTAR